MTSHNEPGRAYRVDPMETPEYRESASDGLSERLAGCHGGWDGSDMTLGVVMVVLSLLFAATEIRCQSRAALQVAVKAESSRPVTVVRVIDGDTVVLMRPDRLETCRLVGVDTPETVHPSKSIQRGGPEASSYLKSWIEGKSVRVEYEKRPTDRYGRSLVYLYADKGRVMVNLVLIRDGFGRFEARYPTRYRPEFKEAERHAIMYGLGIWRSQ